MVAAIILGIIGIVFIVVGIMLWKKEKITLLHDYHYNKVSEKDKKAFCKLSGIGIASVGIGIVATAVIIGITDSPLSFIAFAVGFAVGIAFEIYAGIKYNSNKR